MKKLFSIFLFVMLFVNINKNTAFAQEPQNFLGSVGNRSIEMLLTFGDMNDKNIMELSGTYFYADNQRSTLNLTGALNYDTGKVAMTEKNSQGKTTGFFNGTYDQNNPEGIKITGIWTSVDKKRNLKFSIVKPH